MEDSRDRLLEQISNIKQEQAKMAEQIKAALKRIDEQKALTDSVHSLALSIERLTSAQRSTDTKVDALSRDVDDIKEKPAKRWEDAVKTVITSILSAVVGFFLAHIKMP